MGSWKRQGLKLYVPTCSRVPQHSSWNCVMNFASLYSAGHQGRLFSSSAPAIEALPERPVLRRCRAAQPQARALALAVETRASTESSDMATAPSSGLSDEQIQRFQEQGRDCQKDDYHHSSFIFSGHTCMRSLAPLCVVSCVRHSDNVECSTGFLVLENFAAPEEVQRLRKRAEQLVDDFEPESVSVFSTKSQVTSQIILSRMCARLRRRLSMNCVCLSRTYGLYEACILIKPSCRAWLPCTWAVTSHQGSNCMLADEEDRPVFSGERQQRELLL